MTDFQGAVVGDSLVLFAEDIRSKPTQAVYHAPRDATKHYLTGIDPGRGYDVAVTSENGQWAISVTPSLQGAFVADPAGVLAFTVNGGIAAPTIPDGTAWFTSENLASIGTPDPAPDWFGGGNDNGGNGGGGGNDIQAPTVDGHLAGLVIPALSPAFDPAVTIYTVAVPEGTCSVPVTASLADPELKLHIQSGEVASGATHSAYVCSGGVIDIVVYNGWTEVGRYTVTAVAAPVLPANPPPQPPPPQPAAGTLSGLSVPGLTPAFSPNITQYTVPKPASGTLPVTATLADPSLKLYIQSSETPSGQTRNAWVGEGQSVDIVIYRNWNEVKRYTVTPQ